MAKCGVRDCGGKVVGGFEHHIYATAPDIEPTIIDRVKTLWCSVHKSPLEDTIQHPGRYLTQKDVDRL
jgi:hypothetical protein